MLPIQVKTTTSVKRAHKKSWAKGRNVAVCCLAVCSRGTSIKIRTEARRAITPPSLLGIERRIA